MPRPGDIYIALNGGTRYNTGGLGCKLSFAVHTGSLLCRAFDLRRRPSVPSASPTRRGCRRQRAQTTRTTER